MIAYKKQWTGRIVSVAVLDDQRVKLKEGEKRDKYQDLAGELWNLKMTVIPIIIGVLGTVTKGLVKGLEDSKLIEGEKKD